MDSPRILDGSPRNSLRVLRFLEVLSGDSLRILWRFSKHSLEFSRKLGFLQEFSRDSLHVG